MRYQQTTPLSANVIAPHEDQSLHWFGWFFVVSSSLFPRVCILAFWIFGQQWLPDTFDGSWAVPVVGFFILPHTIMWYALMWGLTSDGVYGVEWVAVGFAFLIDVATWIEARGLLSR